MLRVVNVMKQDANWTNAMARSTFIYLVYHNANDSLLAAFTVKHEAVHWMKICRWEASNLRLMRTRDNGANDHAAQITPCDPDKRN